MKRFMALYVGAPDAFAKWNALDENVRKERETKGMKAWGDWMDKHKAVIVDAGGPLGKTKRTDKNGVSDIANAIGGYVIVEAETHGDAAKLFENHPHFSILPGDAVEIMPCNPIPTI
jgi:hypothetical protein